MEELAHENNMALDMGVLEALVQYMNHGLNPGSFTIALLIDDLDSAYRLAHHHLLPHNHPAYRGQDVVANMVRFINTYCPPCAHGNQNIVNAWMERGGLNKPFTSEELVHMKLMNITWKWWV